MLSKNQQKILKYTEMKVKDLFKNYSAPAHGMEHVRQVIKWATIIAKMEHEDVFLAKMAAILHDVGRTREKLALKSIHWILSYQICKEWFDNDPELKKLSKTDKNIILYSVRYHWNDAADKYPTAWILRDADKMDGMGASAVKRANESFKGDEFAWHTGMRLLFSNYYFIKTKSARKLINKYKMMEPIERLHFKYLCSKLREKF